MPHRPASRTRIRRTLRRSALAGSVIALALTMFCPEAGAVTCSTSTPAVDTSVRDAWQWFENDVASPMTCMDGSMTGFGYYVPSSWNGQVAFILDGGGACYDASTCSRPPLAAATIAWDILWDVKPASSEVPFVSRRSYSCSADFTRDLSSNTSDANGVNWSKSTLSRGVFDRTSSTNPLQNYMTVFVPYCTGDQHAGSRHDTSSTIAGRTPSGVAFYGAADSRQTFSLVLAAAQAAIGKMPAKIVLAGGSAGAFGALYLYPTLRTMVGPSSAGTRIVVISDGGLPLSSGRSADGIHWTAGQRGYWRVNTTAAGAVSSTEQWQDDAWGTSWNDPYAGLQPAVPLAPSTPLGDGHAFIPSQAVALADLANASSPGFWGYQDRFAFVDSTSDWMYWLLMPDLYVNDDPHGYTPTIGQAEQQMVAAGVSTFFPVTNTTTAGYSQYFKHHTFIEDDVSTWSSSGSNLSAFLGALPL